MSLKITITMKSGSKIKVRAKGHCTSNSYGSGERFKEVEDLTCYWPGKGKTREIPEKLYDVEEAYENFWKANETSRDIY